MDDGHGDFRSMFLDALRTALELPHLSNDIVHSLERLASELMRRAPAGVPRHHAESCAWFAAAFRLVGQGDDERGLAVLHKVVDLFGAGVTAYTAAFLDASEDPFIRMVQESKTREREYFGDAFAFERPTDSASAYHLHITDCAYHRVFTAWGLPQLTGVFCRIDEAWIRGIDPPRHGLAFSRPTTIGWGHDRCRFIFERTRG
jgi:hypothetical protein